MFLPIELPEGWIPADGPAEVPQRAARFSCSGGRQSGRRSGPILNVLLL